jgi:alpha-beta hydrolase superfamily lysophospholipase
MLHLPPEKEPPLVVGCHGLFSSSASPKQIALAEHLTRLGVACLRFDHRGCGLSGGHPRHGLSFAGRCRDLAAAVKAARERGALGRSLGLFGSSFGGSVCLATAARVGSSATVTVATPLRSAVLPGLEDGTAARAIGLHFDLDGSSLAAVGNLLIVHGTHDTVVPVQQAHEIFSNITAPKRLLLLAQGDHPLSRPEHQAQLVGEAARWLADGLARN